MASQTISEAFQGLKIKESQDINILLLGETGVGKSTFVNAIANYLHFKTFKKASKADDLLVLIPSVLTVTNERFEQVIITIGRDNNEYQEIGAAGTQGVKTYVFPIGEGKTRLRLIDSPGMGDPRGISQDDINCENILAYLGQLKELHAICFLMKPTTTRKTVLFEYCVKQILSRLEKSASKNIIFVFTNTRGTDYTPGDTLPCLKTVIDDIKTKPPHVDIPLKDNIFSLDNEAFRILVAMKKGVTFTEDIQHKFMESWNNSAKECCRLISYIVGDVSHDALKPHQLYNTISVNEARRIIVQLSQPLADISQLIYDNLRILEKHKLNLKMGNQSLDQLKKKLYIPAVSLEVTQLTQPVTVCTSTKCADVVQVGETGIQKWHYRQRCHDPCYLTTVTKEMVGDLQLQHCAAISGRTCMKCTCDFSVHMHVYYLTKTLSTRIEDKVVKDNINKKEEALRESVRLIDQIDQRKRELEEERNVIITSTAQFAHFLQHNAISPFNDSYKAYIEYLITREQSLGRNGDPEVIHNLEQLLRQYEEIKAAFETSLQLNQQIGLNAILPSTVTAQSVMTTIHQLYQLKHNGKKIHELLKMQKASRNSEYNDSCEYIHPKSSDLSQTEGKKDKSKKDASKKDKKKDGNKTTDDESKRKDKSKFGKKDGKNTEDVRKQNRGPHFQPRPGGPPVNARHHFRPLPNPPTWQEPPPPYDGPRNNQRQISADRRKESEPNVIVKVELNQSGKSQKTNPNYHGNQQGQTYHGPPQSAHHYGPQFSYGPDPNYGPSTNYHGPPPTPTYGPPQGQYYGPPQGQHYGPPPGPYYGPPQGQYHGPPQGQYHGPPQGQYQGPPQGQYQGPPQGQYRRNYSGSGQQGRGRDYYKKGDGNKRGKSKAKSRDRKSGTEKNSKSSVSDSSSD